MFVLCSIDERVAEYGGQLFLDGFGKKLIFSGGSAHQEDLLNTTWGKPEAEHFAEIACDMGVPDDKIIIENKAQNTGQNIEFMYALLRERAEVAVVSACTKTLYGAADFRDVQETVAGCGDGDYRHLAENSLRKVFRRANPKEQVINLVVGDLQRIREYPKLGFQIEQDIPADVWTAYEKLVAAGFTEHVIAEQ